MPVKLGTKLATENAEARIEIVPLIDIMFFLLASFMLVSLSMVNLKSVKVNLPTATTSTPETRKDFVDISVDKIGAIYLDKKPVRDDQLLSALTLSRQKNPAIRVFISGDKNALHGNIIHVLDLVRSAGIEKVAFEIPAAGQGGNAMNRVLNYLNLVGVVLLAVLCALQWRQNSRLNLRAIDLEKTRIEQASKLADQAVTLKQNAADLDDLRDRLERAGVALRESEDKLASAIAERNRLNARNAQLQQALKKWEVALATRDQTIRQAGVEIERLAKERNEAILKFNDLAGKYNTMVKTISSAK